MLAACAATRTTRSTRTGWIALPPFRERKTGSWSAALPRKSREETAIELGINAQSYRSSRDAGYPRDRYEGFARRLRRHQHRRQTRARHVRRWRQLHLKFTFAVPIPP